jgi:hypothetical protein
MKRKIPILFSFTAIACALAFNSYAGIKSAGTCSAMDSSGYIFLHPYFEGKNWKTTYENVDIVLPDTLCSQKLRPIRFDIGKNIDSTIAIFSTANNDLFSMPIYFTPYIGSCSNGEIAFGSPKKIALTGISFTGNTPFYLLKDSLYNFDSIKVVVGGSQQFLLSLLIRPGASSLVRADTLRMQNSGTVVGISGEYSTAINRDTSIWVTGTGGMIGSFSYRRTGWGAEINRSIAGLTDTVLCARGLYAGTNMGRIYKKNASQVFTLDNSFSKKSINALYPQGAIGNGGNFVELIGGSWRLDTLGSSNYRYANFIKRSGGFGVELLDARWRYSVFTYRDSSSKILLTIPPDRFSYVNNGTYRYPLSNQDTGMTLYILDADSNYRDIDMTLKRGVTQQSLKTDGTYAISPMQDTETCHTGILRLTDGVIAIGLKGGTVTVKSQTELGAYNNCGVCYWKKYNFTAQKNWANGDSIIIRAGKDVLKIFNNSQGSVTTAFETLVSNNSNDKNALWCDVGRGKITLHTTISGLKSITIYDVSGRMLAFTPSATQSLFELPRSFSANVIYVHAIFKNGAVIRRVLPILH